MRVTQKLSFCSNNMQFNNVKELYVSEVNDFMTSDTISNFTSRLNSDLYIWFADVPECQLPKSVSPGAVIPLLFNPSVDCPCPCPVPDSDPDPAPVPAPAPTPSPTQDFTMSKKSQHSKNSPMTGTCIFWLKGHCKNGLNCEFLHELRDCEFWLNGHCKNGKNCTFAHNEDKKATKNIGIVLRDCDFWLKGYCYTGKSCTFAHDPEKLGMTQKDCEFWIRGHCNNGKKCTFKHDAKKMTSVKSQFKDLPCSKKGVLAFDRAKCKYVLKAK